jgi:hypothetical protein
VESLREGWSPAPRLTQDGELVEVGRRVGRSASQSDSIISATGGRGQKPGLVAKQSMSPASSASRSPSCALSDYFERRVRHEEAANGGAVSEPSASEARPEIDILPLRRSIDQEKSVGSCTKEHCRRRFRCAKCRAGWKKRLSLNPATLAISTGVGGGRSPGGHSLARAARGRCHHARGGTVRCARAR